MSFDHYPRAVTVKVPATSANLGPGFDCLGLALDLTNEFTLASSGIAASPLTNSTRLTVIADGIDAKKIPLDSSNLVIEAAEGVFRRVGRWPSDLTVRLHNQIPVGSGLGSSSSAIIAGLLAGNALVDGDLTEDQLLDIAVDMEGHPDNVAPALLGGLVLGVLPDLVQGPDRLVVRRWDPPQIKAIIVLPDFFLPTSEARAALPPSADRSDTIFNSSRLGLLLSVLIAQEFEQLRVAMGDRIHQPYRMKLIPGAPEAYHAAYEMGAVGVAISGAGPSLLAFAKKDEREIADSMISAFKDAGLSSRSWILNPSSAGASLVITPA